eukprot:Nk52_evm4s156 gene=Nk52_evmTU4s156
MQYLMISMVLSSISNALLSTGAFEVFFEGQQVWSAIESGEVPHVEEIAARLGTACSSIIM